MSAIAGVSGSSEWRQYFGEFRGVSKNFRNCCGLLIWTDTKIEMMEKRLDAILGDLKDHEILDLLDQLGSPSHSRIGGWTYVISTRERFPCKIGWAKDPEKKRADMQAHNPDELFLQFSVKSKWPKRVESHAKRLLKPFQRRPRHEWYDVEVDAAISAVKEAVSICTDPEKRGETASYFDKLKLFLLHPDFDRRPTNEPPRRRKWRFLE